MQAGRTAVKYFLIALVWFGLIHSLSASAYYPAGQFTMAVTNNFTVLGTNNVTDVYDASGNVTNRIFASGKTQMLQWDAAGRLVGLVQRDNPTNGFNWTAIYDAAGRRLRTIQVPVVNGYTNYVGTLTLDSYFDPQVEFEEIAVGVNGQRTWKVLGPDLDGKYGSLQGVGGLEATVRESDGLTTPVLNDYFGNVLATISGTTTSWSPVRVGGYGAVLGYQSPTLTANTPLADTLAWRSRGIDPSGFYNLGARYYDPVAGHFLSADPLGHAASMDLHSFCGGDPINRFDPTGRFGKGNFSEGYQHLQTAGTQFREGARVLDVAYGDQIQQTFMAVDLAAVSFVVPEIAEGLLEEGFGLEAEAGIGLRAEGEAALGEGETAALTETRVASTIAEDAGAMEAQTLASEARLAEPGITPDILQLAEQTGGQIAGFQNVLKSEASLTTKLAGTPAGQIQDALRYSITYENQALAKGSSESIAKLEASGYEKIRVRNTFIENATYKGINTIFRSPEGQSFELQFHTPESYNLKQATHPLYETLRGLPNNSPESSQIVDQLREASKKIIQPPNVQQLVPNY